MSLKRKYSEQTVDIENSGRFWVEVVGESFYAKNLQYCYSDDDVIIKKGRSRAKIIVVELELDDYNKHDKWAVAVISRYGIIGHLSREMAVIYRQKYQGRQNLRVHALISSKDPSSGIFGAWLDLPIDADKREPLPIPSEGGRIEWKKQTRAIRDKYEFSDKYDKVNQTATQQGCAGAFIFMSGVLIAAISIPVVKFFA